VKGLKVKEGKEPGLPWRERRLKRLGAYGSRVTQTERQRRDDWRSFKGEGFVVRGRQPSPGPAASRGMEGLRQDWGNKSWERVAIFQCFQ